MTIEMVINTFIILLFIIGFLRSNFAVTNGDKLKGAWELSP